MELYQVKLNLTPKQVKQIMKKRPTQVKKDQLDSGMLVSLNKDNWKRYKRAKSQKTGFRVIADDEMIGAGFADVLKSGLKKLGAVAVPYARNIARTVRDAVLPGIKSDVGNAVNTGVDFVSSKLKSGLSGIIGQDLSNELVDRGSTSVKNLASNTINQAEGYLRGLGLKRGPKYHYQIRGGKLSLSLGKIADILKPIAKMAAKIAVPALASSVGGPAAAVASSMLTDTLIGEGTAPLLYLRRPGALPHEKEQLKGKGLTVLAVPKRKATMGRRRKINGAALLPMGMNRGGALFPM